MKGDIIVAIDFSVCSVNALRHAVTIAAKAQSRVIMVHVLKGTGNPPVIYKYADPMDQATKLLEELVEEFKDRLPEGNLVFRIRNGKVYREVVEEARENDASLIVAGTHGSSGFEEFWIGSNAYRMVASAPCPVITIREAVRIDYDLKRIVLPIDTSIDTRQKVTYAVKLAKIFDAEIHILTLLEGTVREVHFTANAYAKQVAEIIEKANVPYVLTSVKSKNNSDSILTYASKVEANLIVIMTDQEPRAINLLLGQYAQQLINLSSIPVMSVPPKELMLMGSR